MQPADENSFVNYSDNESYYIPTTLAKNLTSSTIDDIRDQCLVSKTQDNHVIYIYKDFCKVDKLYLDTTTKRIVAMYYAFREKSTPIDRETRAVQAVAELVGDFDSLSKLRTILKNEGKSDFNHTVNAIEEIIQDKEWKRLNPWSGLEIKALLHVLKKYSSIPGSESIVKAIVQRIEASPLKEKFYIYCDFDFPGKKSPWDYLKKRVPHIAENDLMQLPREVLINLYDRNIGETEIAVIFYTLTGNQKYNYLIEGFKEERAVFLIDFTDIDMFNRFMEFAKNNDYRPHNLYALTMNDPLFCDTTLIFGDEKLLVNKRYLSLKSPYFKHMFESHFKESKSSEITLDAEEKEIVEYLYTGNIKIDPSRSLEIMNKAQYYGLPELSGHCTWKINNSRLDYDIDSLQAILDASITYEYPFLEEVVAAAVAEHIYSENEPPGLEAFIIKNRHFLNKNMQFVNESEAREELNEVEFKGWVRLKALIKGS